MKSFLDKGVSFILGRIKTPNLFRIVSLTVADRVRKLPPKSALTFLFDLENVIYSQLGPIVKQYGRGVHSKHRHMKYHDFFLSHLRPGERVLDVGCGEGVVAYDLARRAQIKIDGIDYDAGKIAVAKKKYRRSNLQFSVQDATRFVPKHGYDVVVLSNVLEHIVGRPSFLRRLIKQTRAKRFLIRVPSFERDWRVPLKKEIGAEWRLDPDHKIEYTLDQFHKETTKAGLSVSHLEIRWGEIWSELKPNHSS